MRLKSEGVSSPQDDTSRTNPPRQVNPVVNVLSLLIAGLGATMAIPLFIEMARTGGHPIIFALPLVGTVTFGLILLAATRGAARLELDHRQAFLVTALSWVSMPLIAALPFLLAGMSWTDAVFESASGLTTTGSTVIQGLDNWPASLLFWRSFLQWIGGVGIIVTAVALLPFMRVGGMQLFRAESSDQSEKIEPRAHIFVVRILVIYCSLTAACAGLFAILGMSGFDALNHAMTTLSTGGFSTHDASFGYFQSGAMHITAIIFMLAGAIPFVVFIKFLNGDRAIFIRDPQVTAYIGVLLTLTIVLGLWHFRHSGDTLGQSMLTAGFNIVSVATTTGFASVDYTLWGNAAGGIFFFLTFLGGCAGSTAGGVKVYRILVLYQIVVRHLRTTIRPSRVVSRTFDGRRLAEDAWIGVLVMVVVYFATFVIFATALGFAGLDLTTALSGSATAIANVGPGLGDIIGPSGNFASLPAVAKWLLAVEMILGRLEVLSFLVVIMPGFWD
ncbi:TrkH family potassium uptake protein [uncultured Maricaulis sp.]|uniref:TrkH family potassium uptake protein n=1 Tax=uncultured Maricaulis sp. TaxID=174710 RepID=UPI0030DB864A